MRKLNTELEKPKLTETSSSVIESEPGTSSANTNEWHKGSAVHSVLDSDSEEELRFRPRRNHRVWKKKVIWLKITSFLA